MASPPTGTLTFLFTDIEGSTRLWERDAPAMQAALTHHDELLRLAIEERGGYVFKTVGDVAQARRFAPRSVTAAPVRTSGHTTTLHQQQSSDESGRRPS